MSDTDDIKSILIEIRDNQLRSLEKQEEHVALARQQLDRAKVQIEESIALQRQAMAKAKSIARVAVPGILLCILAILYLVVRYF